MRPELEPLPPRMEGLPLDDRGYPIPWFVAYVDGKPEFRAMDLEKFVRALKEKLCWVCGERLGIYIAFVSGPMCGINRTTTEPPSHKDCAVWSARNCPFMNNPRVVRREDDSSAAFSENNAGISIKRNPGVAMVWNTRYFETFRDPSNKDGGILIQMGEPDSVEWYFEGKPATREPVVESIESGLPILEALAMRQEGGMEALARYRRRFDKWIPAH